MSPVQLFCEEIIDHNQLIIYKTPHKLNHKYSRSYKNTKFNFYVESRQENYLRQDSKTYDLMKRHPIEFGPHTREHHQKYQTELVYR